MLRLGPGSLALLDHISKIEEEIRAAERADDKRCEAALCAAEKTCQASIDNPAAPD